MMSAYGILDDVKEKAKKESTHYEQAGKNQTKKEKTKQAGKYEI